VINHLNDRARQSLSRNLTVPSSLDVNHDGWVSPIDALLVINELNANSSDAAKQAEEPLPLPAIADDVAAAVSASHSPNAKKDKGRTRSSHRDQEAAAADAALAELAGCGYY
jgi:hypothetical protein